MIKYSPSHGTDEGRLLAAIIRAGYFPRLDYEGTAGWYVYILWPFGDMLARGNKRTRRGAIIEAIKNANRKLKQEIQPVAHTNKEMP